VKIIINKLSISSESIKHNSLIDLLSKSNSPVKVFNPLTCFISLIINPFIDWIFILFLESISFCKTKKVKSNDEARFKK